MVRKEVFLLIIEELNEELLAERVDLVSEHEIHDGVHLLSVFFGVHRKLSLAILELRHELAHALFGGAPALLISGEGAVGLVCQEHVPGVRHDLLVHQLQHTVGQNHELGLLYVELADGRFEQVDTLHQLLLLLRSLRQEQEVARLGYRPYFSLEVVLPSEEAVPELQVVRLAIVARLTVVPLLAFHFGQRPLQSQVSLGYPFVWLIEISLRLQQTILSLIPRLF